MEQPCPDCQGKGQSTREASLTVKVPRGVEEGVALRIPGYGMAAEDGAAQPGDLFVVIHSATDPRFDRRGADLWRVERIEVADASLGADHGDLLIRVQVHVPEQLSDQERSLYDQLQHLKEPAGREPRPVPLLVMLS